MSTGMQILVGVAVAIVLFAGWLGLRRRKPVERRPAHVAAPATRGGDDDRIHALLARGEKIQAIKELRERTGMGLAEAKAYVDGLAAAPPAYQATPDLTRVVELAESGKQIEAIKELRGRTGLGLKDAKDYVDALVATGEPPPPRRAGVNAATLARARELVAAGKKIHAVKAVREETGWGLKQAKDFVDRL